MAIGVGSSREPIFPVGISGSITHTGNYCAASVIKKGRTRSIGIEAEDSKPLGDESANLVLLPDERLMTARMRGLDWYPDTTIFSIKEAFCKAYYQIASNYLDFLGARVELMPEKVHSGLSY